MSDSNKIKLNLRSQDRALSSDDLQAALFKSYETEQNAAGVSKPSVTTSAASTVSKQDSVLRKRGRQQAVKPDIDEVWEDLRKRQISDGPGDEHVLANREIGEVIDRVGAVVGGASKRLRQAYSQAAIAKPSRRSTGQTDLVTSLRRRPTQTAQEQQRLTVRPLSRFTSLDLRKTLRDPESSREDAGALFSERSKSVDSAREGTEALRSPGDSGVIGILRKSSSVESQPDAHPGYTQNNRGILLGSKFKQMLGQRRRLVIGLLAVGVVVMSAMVFVGKGKVGDDDLKEQTLGSSARSSEVDRTQLPASGGAEVVETTDFKLLYPSSKTSSEYEIAKVSPPGSAPVYAYLDDHEGAQLRISQQAIPPEFIGQEDVKLAEVATDFQATDVLQVDELKVYYGFTERFGGGAVTCFYQ